MGTAGLVARPMASVLEAMAMGKAAQSIRNRSSPQQANRIRVRLARPLSRELPLLPYTPGRKLLECLLYYKQMIRGLRMRDSWCAQLVGFHSPEYVGVATDPGWVIKTEMNLESVVHIDREESTVNIVGSNLSSKQTKGANKNRRWSPRPSSPLFQISVDLPCEEEAMGVLQLLVSTIEQGLERRQGVHILERSHLR